MDELRRILATRSAMVELERIARVYGRDRTAVFIDARAEEAYARGTVSGASLPVAKYVSGALKKAPLPEDDFNTRIVLFGENGAQARGNEQTTLA